MWLECELHLSCADELKSGVLLIELLGMGEFVKLKETQRTVDVSEKLDSIIRVLSCVPF